jgi:hypothetical protein
MKCRSREIHARMKDAVFSNSFDFITLRTLLLRIAFRALNRRQRVSRSVAVALMGIVGLSDRPIRARVVFVSSCLRA